LTGKKALKSLENRRLVDGVGGVMQFLSLYYNGMKEKSQNSENRVDRLKVGAYNADIERGGAVASGG
jgi:hypothetical protein